MRCLVMNLDRQIPFWRRASVKCKTYKGERRGDLSNFISQIRQTDALFDRQYVTNVSYLTDKGCPVPATAAAAVVVGQWGHNS